jgi:hypothetical protein
MTITLRSEKGAKLTVEEADGNIIDLDGRLEVVEDGQSSVRSIEDIRQVSNSLFIDYTDSTTDGPFTFEVSIHYRGDWVASTVYSHNDLVKANGVIYIVLVDHTSELVFDPGAISGSDGDLYAEFLELPELTIPSGGDAGTVLTKATSTDYDYQWSFAGVPVGGTAGQILVKLSGDDYDTGWGTSEASPVTTVATSTLTLSAGYAGLYVRCTNLAGCTITIPVDADVDFDVGTEIHIRQSNAGPVDIVGSTAGLSDGDFVQINGIDGHDFGTDTDGAVVTIKKIGDNEWDLFGLLRTGSGSDSS